MPLIVITGASQGLGAAIADAFSTVAEAQLALVARSADKLDAVAARCRARGAEAVVFPCDVADADAVAAMAEDVAETFGVPEVLVNNAGVFIPGDVAETPVETFRAQLDVNLTSAFLVTQAFLPGMTARRTGTLFFMASVASVRGYPGGAAYCAAKHGLLGLARALREETKPHGLRVMTLLPGAALTPSWAGVDLPENRFMPPEDIAQTVLHLWQLSDRTVVEEILLRPQLGDV